jgi:hypothetical protein
MVEAEMLVGAVLAVVGIGVGNQDGRRPEGSHKICNDAQPRWRGEEWSRIVVEAPALGCQGWPGRAHPYPGSHIGLMSANCPLFRGTGPPEASVHPGANGARGRFEEPSGVRCSLDGRVRLWVFIDELGRYLRVVTLGDGETVHNAFLDRDFDEGSE